MPVCGQNQKPHSLFLVQLTSSPCSEKYFLFLLVNQVYLHPFNEEFGKTAAVVVK